MDKKPLVLIVDDDPDIVDIAAQELRSAGFLVESAPNAALGFECLKAQHPDFILLDINMPGMNGTEMLLDLKKNSITKDIKVAIFTNMSIPWPGASSSPDAMARELGAVGYIDKTAHIGQMAEIVKRYMAEGKDVTQTP